MRIVVTGATSFIGRAVTEELLSGGHQVIGTVRPDSPGRRLLPGKESGNLSILILSLSEIDGILKEPKMKGGADAWIHLGWEGAGSANRENPQLQARNIDYALNALKTASALGCTRFLFSGSQAEYGIVDGVMREDRECHPVSEYGKDKLKVLNLCAEKGGQLGITYIHARIFSVFGPGDHPWSLISTSMNTFLKGGVMELGACTQMWNFLYVRDCARALVGLLLAKAPGGVYNVAGEDTRPLRSYIEELYRLCGGNGSYRYGKRPPNAEGEVSLMPDIQKLKDKVGFCQETSFETGIRRMLCLMSMEGGMEGQPDPHRDTGNRMECKGDWRL